MSLKNKFASVLLLCCCSFIFVSCSDEDDDYIQPSTTIINMEGEGGEHKISFTHGDWNITSVKNKAGDGRTDIFGEIYSAEGKLIRENEKLELNGLGQLTALWNDKGFRIIRSSLDSLIVIVVENSTETDFSFAIEIKAGNEAKEIVIAQNKSKGYEFESLEYTLNEEDGDSIYMTKQTSYNLNLGVPQDFIFCPYNGIDVVKKHNFESSDNNAFVWLKDAPIEVKLPKAIYDGKLIYTNEKYTYTDTSVANPHDFQDLEETVSLPAGENKFHIDVEFRRRMVSYTLTLINKRTSEKKIVEGKWIETAPTGKYEIIFQE